LGGNWETRKGGGPHIRRVGSPQQRLLKVVSQMNQRGIRSPKKGEICGKKDAQVSICGGMGREDSQPIQGNLAWAWSPGPKNAKTLSVKMVMWTILRGSPRRKSGVS